MQKIQKKIQLTTIDSSHSIDSAPCQSLSVGHNIRHSPSGGVVSVALPQRVSQIADFSFYEILHKHSVVGGADSHYIARNRESIDLVEVSDGGVKQIQLLMALPKALDRADLKVYSMGNMLFVQQLAEGLPTSQTVFQWYEGSYHSRNLVDIPSPRASIDYNLLSTAKFYLIPVPIVAAKLSSEERLDDDRFMVASYDYNYQLFIDNFVSLDYIYGAVFFIFAYRLIDGSIINYSPIVPADCQNWSEYEPRSLYYCHSGLSLDFYHTLYAIKPKLTFDVPQEVVDNPLVESIVIYSTRNNPLYVFEDINNVLDYHDADVSSTVVDGVEMVHISIKSLIDKASVGATSNIFYEIAEVDFRESPSIQLSYNKHYRNIEQYPIFAPNLSPHSLFASLHYSSSSQLHLLDVTMKFFGGTLSVLDVPQLTLDQRELRRYTTLGEIVTRVTIVDNGVTTVAQNSTQAPTYIDSTSEYILLPSIITYPDVRATKIEFLFRHSLGALKPVVSFTLEASLESGFAYSHNLEVDKPISYIAYPIINEVVAELDLQGSIRFPNRLASSVRGNPLLFEFDGIVDIESSDLAIVGVESCSKELKVDNPSDYPLYIFSTSGIFAVEASSTSDYFSRYVSISTFSNSTIIASLSVDTTVYFLSIRGLYSINGSSLKFLSQSIERYAFRELPFVEYIVGAQLLYLAAYDEIVIHNSIYDYCYIYECATGALLTRDFGFRGVCGSLFCGLDGLYDLSLFEDSHKPLYSIICSHPTTFDIAASKRVSRFTAVGLTPSSTALTLLGSNSGRAWSVVRRISNSSSPIKKIMSSWLYYQFAIEGVGLSLDYCEIEVQQRHR